MKYIFTLMIMFMFVPMFAQAPKIKSNLPQIICCENAEIVVTKDSVVVFTLCPDITIEKTRLLGTWTSETRFVSPQSQLTFYINRVELRDSTGKRIATYYPLAN